MTSLTMGMLAKTVSNTMQREIISNPDKVYFPFLGGDNIFTNGFKLNNVMFKIPGTNFVIYWYGFLIALGILIAMIYGFRRMRSFGINPDSATDSVIGGLIGAIVGARLYYVIFSLSDYMTESGSIDWKAIISVRDGGLAIYGGLIGAILVGGIIAKIKKLKLVTLLDVVAPGFLIGQAIGRWGNFFNQEAFGSNTTLPWGMMSSKTVSYLSEIQTDLADKAGVVVDQYAPVHPCFLYESLWCILGLVLLHLYAKHRKFDGEIFLMYIGWYGLGRFFIEMLRTDSLYLANIKVSELVAGTCVLVSVVLIIIFRSMVKRNGDYKLYADTAVSKAQLAEYDMFEKMKAEKSELKKKINDAKAKGEDFSALQAEYDRKFGKNAVKSEIKAELFDEGENYTPIADNESLDLDMDNIQDENDIKELNELEPVEQNDNNDSNKEEAEDE